MKKLDFNISMEGKPEKIGGVVEKVLDNLKKIELGEDLLFDIECSLKELLNNAVEHGCKGKGGRVNLHCWIQNKRLMLSIKDPGCGFNWKEKDLEHMPMLEEKGRGLAIVYSLVDKMYFNDSGNEITIEISLEG